MSVGLSVIILIVAVAGIIYAVAAAKHRLKISTRIVAVIFLTIIAFLAIVYILLAATLSGVASLKALDPIYIFGISLIST